MRRLSLWLVLGIAASAGLVAAAWLGRSFEIPIFMLAVLWGAVAIDWLAARMRGDERPRPETPHPLDLPPRVAGYLETLDHGLDLPADVRSEIGLEIACHLEDSIASLEAEGLDAERATGEALARLGRPEELARQLRRAHQTTRRLLAGAAGGVFSAGVGVVQGYVVATFSAIMVLLAAAVAGAVAQRAGLSISLNLSDPGGGTIFGCLLAWVAAFVAAHRAVRASAERSRRPVRQLGRGWAIAGGAVLLFLVLFVVDMGQSWLAVPFELGVPLAFAAGALVWTERTAPRLPLRAVIALGTVVLIAPVLLLAAATTQAGGWSFSYTEASLRLDHVAPAWLTSGAPVASGSTIGYGPTADVRWTLQDPNVLARFHDLRAEVWRGSPFPGRPAGSSFAIVDTSYASPYVSYPVTFAGDTADTRIDVGHSRTTSWWVVLVGIGPDGHRYRLGAGDFESQFSGTLMDWLTASQ